MLLPFVDNEQRTQLLQLIQIVKNFTNALDNFQQDFKIEDYAMSIISIYK